MKTRILILIITLLSLAIPAQAASLNVCVSVPELGDLASIIGGKHVNVSVFVKGQEDPHALVARPSNVLALSKADAFIIVGMGLEQGWAPAMIDRSRNLNVQIGAFGYIDTSSVITPIQDTPMTVVTRALGDVHPEGNPHFIMDPVNGLKVARFISQSFSVLKPSLKDTFKNNFEQFEKLWAYKAFGKTITDRYGIDALVKLVEKKKLKLFLNKTKEMDSLKGWFKDMAEIEGANLVSDHEQWIYFGQRFDLKIQRALEPRPGIPAGTKYLKHIVEWIKANNVKGVLASPYFNPRQLAFVEKNSGTKIIPMAHQCGARPGTDTYFSMIDYNIKQVLIYCKAK